MRLSSKIIPAILIGLPAALLQSCGLVTEEPQACPATLSVRLVYDYNIKYADAFPREVKSVNVWAFDESGRPVWSHSESGDRLASGEYRIDTPLPEGRYDFVAWCGLENNTGFDLATYTPSSKEELLVTLRTSGDAEGTEPVECKSFLPPLFNGVKSGVEYDVDPYAPSLLTAEIPLMKDTKDIRILLQHLDGTPIKASDFTATITADDARLAWNNEVLPSAPVVYSPWNVKYGEVSSEGAPAGEKTKAITSVATLMFEFSTSRMMLDRGATLTVRLNGEDRDVIRIPLLDYLILVKGHYPDMTDQEYLDRQDDYSVMFFIDGDNNWYTANGIYVNGWAVVPPQEGGI